MSLLYSIAGQQSSLAFTLELQNSAALGNRLLGASALVASGWRSG